MIENINRVAVAEVAGERHLRSDMEFTLDLIFESASRESRRRLREIDEQRWALTVIARGTDADAEEAFDFLVEDAERRGRSVSMFAAGLRSPLQAVRLIARSCPDLVSVRRERLLKAIGSPAAHSRFNALWILASQESDEDESGFPRWSRTRRGGSHSWPQRPQPHGECETHSRTLKPRSRVEGRYTSVSASCGSPFGWSKAEKRRSGSSPPCSTMASSSARAPPRLPRSLDLDGYLDLLGRRTHDSRIPEWLLNSALDVAGPGDWTDERVEKMVEAVVDQDGDPQVASHERLVNVVASHLEPALAAARRALYHRPPAFRGLAMFAKVPAEKLAGEENAAIVEGARRALSPEELSRWRRNVPQDYRSTALARLEDSEADPADVLAPEMHWRVSEISQDQREKLGELAVANLPPVDSEIDGERFGGSRTDGLRWAR